MRLIFSISRKNGGFSLTELLVVIAVVGILAAIIFPYYGSVRKQLSLQRSANKLVQDIRRAQGMALSAEEVGGEIPEGGYGIYLKKNPSPQKSYILFADKNFDHIYTPGVGAEERIEEISFEEGVKIKNLSANHINIIFQPPEPGTYLKDNDGNDLGPLVTIEICLIDDELKSKTIKINKAGLIYVE